MFKYVGKLTRTTAGSARRGDQVKVDFTAPTCGPHMGVAISDLRYESRRALSNSRFDFRSRDSHIDLLNRHQWAPSGMILTAGDSFCTPLS